jgi:hypothetical protein
LAKSISVGEEETGHQLLQQKIIQKIEELIKSVKE